MFLAHKTEERTQSLKEHLVGTANLCRKMAIEPLKDILYLAGLSHDIGKYQQSFQRRINGENIRVEHSTCGSQVIRSLLKDPVSVLIQLIVMGHHSGIPDFGSKSDDPDSQSTFFARINRQFESVQEWENEIKDLMEVKIDNENFFDFLTKDCTTKENLVDKFSFITRYCFSVLTDADSIETASFCNGFIYQSMLSDFKTSLERLENYMYSLPRNTELQKARNNLLEQVMSKVDETTDVSLMNMPTGSGKTLCSLRFALERIKRSKRKRIIYVIPYNSIIDQTADTFRRVLGDSAQILLHQSTLSHEEDYLSEDDDLRYKLKAATENWNADFIITTAVQFFESLHGNKRGRLRKIHNMEDSIIIFDEVHMMPSRFLQPCLQSIAYLVRYLNCEAVFLTATMPDFRSLLLDYTFPDIKVTELIDDKKEFRCFSKCDYENLGRITDESLLERISDFNSRLIIVNSKRTAREIYNIISGKKYHLSTYMTVKNRKEVINRIKDDLRTLSSSFPYPQSAPPEEHITVVATSLIEAGVDIDLHCVVRELNGLESILQAGGRCNREGELPSGKVYIFERIDSEGKSLSDEKINITKSILSRYEDVSSPEAVKDYFSNLYLYRKEDLSAFAMHNFNGGISNPLSIPFATYADRFRLIESDTESVVVATDSYSQSVIDSMKYTGYGNSRALQEYALTVSRHEFEELRRSGIIQDFGTGIFILNDSAYYSEEIGILFERKEFSDDNTICI